MDLYLKTNDQDVTCKVLRKKLLLQPYVQFLEKKKYSYEAKNVQWLFKKLFKGYNCVCDKLNNSIVNILRHPKIAYDFCICHTYFTW